ncbi:J domain-containing protein [Gloeocapsopsis dulcis]|uniref:Molecular chaperone DnaJ n=1 Tax=Gloeocapsopsis dulcis AAB1 = 1H9 TaxID=1433147 RepID=A0A6N8FRS6_9CHRO|nr:J domain-containing protein [Gloeocapsopsis dulcis]MUL35035.1 molecular chaperone DnaJ [Gloeocapsopsis dulcis AAB1 = 1H9]WNN89887.1 J domain-containing protein [Gloeocapsopsis dulcis]
MSQQERDRTSIHQNSYYALLGIHPSASPIEIRRAYRELSKRYHPDTTDLPKANATAKFQQINEAYATLSSPERRSQYDLKIGYSRVAVIQVPVDLNRPASTHAWRSRSAYLEPTDRPLSSGEIFALFLLLLTFVCCIVLAITVALTRGDIQSTTSLKPPTVVQQSIKLPNLSI